MLPDTAINQYSLPGFSPEQIQSLINLIQIIISQAFDRHFGPYQSSTSIQPTTQPVTRQSSNSLAKKKRNLRTRNQKKKKAQAQAHVTVQVQEVDQSHVQEVDYVPKVRVCVKKTPSNHVVLKRSVQWICTSLYTVIQSDWMAMVAGMMIIEYGVNRMRRLGVG